VYEVVSFYTMYNQNQSEVYCLNFVKHHPVVNGTEDLMDYTCEKLGVNWREIQQMDFEVKVECLGACGYAP
jgi:NADH-quinone oxidoreductase subunit E